MWEFVLGVFRCLRERVVVCQGFQQGASSWSAVLKTSLFEFGREMSLLA
jgi:hypothetical protein